MMTIMNDQMLPRNTSMLLRKNEQGLMLRSRNDVFETFSILGKTKKSLLGMTGEGRVTVIEWKTPVAPTVEIKYKDCKVDVRSTVNYEEALKMVNDAIERLKWLI